MEGKPVDLGLVTEGWNSKKGKWAPTAEVVERRAREVRRWLMGRKEKSVVLVTHGGFVHFLTEDWSDSGRFNGSCAVWRRRCVTLRLLTNVWGRHGLGQYRDEIISVSR